jgi:CheY-like chemotaxis protein
VETGAMHALIIEDEPMIALLIEDHLRALGCTTVDFAVTEAEALAAADRNCPDVITSDVWLAHGCGIAAVEAICKNRQIPVVFITANVLAVREKMIDAFVIAKPFGPVELTRALVAAGIAA